MQFSNDKIVNKMTRFLNVIRSECMEFHQEDAKFIQFVLISLSFSN